MSSSGSHNRAILKQIHHEEHEAHEDKRAPFVFFVFFVYFVAQMF
jgi:hypothetical protein